MDIEALGYVTQVRCASCTEHFPVFTFSADTDMVTYGYISLTNLETKDIGVVSAASGENYQALVSRASVEFGPKFCFSAPLIKPAKGKAGVSFQEFLKSYEPPVISYSCIFCSGVASAVGIETVLEFRSHNSVEVLA